VYEKEKCLTVYSVTHIQSGKHAGTFTLRTHARTGKEKEKKKFVPKQILKYTAALTTILN
jgi:hypothetical protein